MKPELEELERRETPSSVALVLGADHAYLADYKDWSAHPGGYLGQDYYTTRGHQGGETYVFADFILHAPAAGTYGVAVTWQADSHLSSSAAWTIDYGGQSVAGAFVNQQLAPNPDYTINGYSFQVIGTVTTTATSGGRVDVILSQTGAGNVEAFAVALIAP